MISVPLRNFIFSPRFGHKFYSSEATRSLVRNDRSREIADLRTTTSECRSALSRKWQSPDSSRSVRYHGAATTLIVRIFGIRWISVCLFPDGRFLTHFPRVNTIAKWSTTFCQVPLIKVTRDMALVPFVSLTGRKCRRIFDPSRVSLWNGTNRVCRRL